MDIRVLNVFLAQINPQDLPSIPHRIQTESFLFRVVLSAAVKTCSEEMSRVTELTLSMSFVPQNAHKVPPPWLIAMQRYGPPPSYPNLKIPGLNSPIPEVRQLTPLS